jgi:hypothetical protein
MSEKTYPNAGKGCDRGRYRTGEVPQLGDVVRSHRDPILPDEDLTPDDEMPTGEEATVIKLPRATPGFLTAQHDHTVELWYAARFDLISRAEPAPAEPAAELKAADNMDASGFYTKGCLAQETPAAVITGPGKYIEEQTETADVVATDGKVWFGFDSCGDAAAWHSSGKRFSNASDNLEDLFSDAWNLIGPYVPPPEPVLKVEEVAQHDRWSLLAFETTLKGGQDSANLTVSNGLVPWACPSMRQLHIAPGKCCVATPTSNVDWIKKLVATVNAEAAKS